MSTPYAKAYAKATKAMENLMRAERTKIPSAIKDARQALDEATADLKRVKSKESKPNENST